jgi:hypothetical protein
MGRYSESELRTLRELTALRNDIDRRMRANVARIEAAARIAPWILGRNDR